MSLSKLKDIFETERSTRQLNKRIGPKSYSDEYATTTYYFVNTYFGLEQVAKNLRNVNRKSLNFETGYVVMYVCNRDASGETSYNHLVVMPLDKFLEVFSDPKALAEQVEAKARQLIKEWTLLNGDPESAGQRTQTEKAFTLFENKWKTNFGRVQQRSEYELQLQTWGFTDLYNRVARPPPMQLYDVKLVIKLKSSLDARDVVDRSSVVDNLKYEASGYNSVTPHFVGVLTSRNFVAWVAELVAYREEQLEEELQGRDNPQTRGDAIKLLLAEKEAAAAGSSGSDARKRKLEELAEEGRTKKQQQQRRSKQSGTPSVQEQEEEPEGGAAGRKQRKKGKSKAAASAPTTLYLETSGGEEDDDN